MRSLDEILKGFEAALELERELGVRSVELDRTLLVPIPQAAGDSPSVDSNKSDLIPLAFVHDRPLSVKAIEMMAKILEAMKLSAKETPIAVAPPIPAAELYVFLGAAALRRYLPGVRLGVNAWGKSPKGKDILLVRSPEDIVRYATPTPAVMQIKREMWQALRSVLPRLREKS